MLQLSINGVSYPETSRDRFQIWQEDLGVTIRMAGGNLVKEKRGKVWHISYEYDYFYPALMNRCLADLRSGNELNVSFLMEDGTYASGLFRASKFPTPTFAFSRDYGNGSQGVWHNISFELEGVETI